MLVFLQNTKEKLVEILNKIPFLKRGSFFFQTGRAIFRFFWRTTGKNQMRAVTKLRHFLLSTGALSSYRVTPEDCVIELKDGRFFVWDPTDPNSLLSIIICRDRGLYDQTEAAVFKLLVRPGQTVMDIGASFGWWSVVFARLVGSAGKLYCFEPEPQSYSELQKNMGLNFHDRTRFNLEQIALSDKLGSEPFLVQKSLGPAFARLITASEREHTSQGEVRDVEVITLDSYVQKNAISKVDFIKCDVEGKTIEVLRGATQLLKREDAPLLWSEVNSTDSREIFSFLKNFGYQPYTFDKGDLRPLKEGERAPYHNLFVKKSRIKDVPQS
ncbi:MAG: FkbM family methyltransferase [Patescibacteria group bacterium]|nr:FkbM family methyltransferase [Patescibacteria group bacterium]